MDIKKLLGKSQKSSETGKHACINTKGQTKDFKIKPNTYKSYLWLAEAAVLMDFHQKFGLVQSSSVSELISSAGWSMFGLKNAWSNVTIFD